MTFIQLPTSDVQTDVHRVTTHAFTSLLFYTPLAIASCYLSYASLYNLCNTLLFVLGTHIISPYLLHVGTHSIRWITE